MEVNIDIKFVQIYFQTLDLKDLKLWFNGT